MDRPSGAGERRDEKLDAAEAKALGAPPPAPPSSPPPSPASSPPKPSIIDRVKKVFNISESPHNPDNVAGESHGPDDRGFT